jgi:uncharacterized membrane protein YeaQ/YmgE (transglycosylase-associated protein family)
VAGRADFPVSASVFWKLAHVEEVPMLAAILQSVAVRDNNHVWVLSTQGTWLAWIIIGLIAGWIAGLISRGRGFGCIGNLILGLIGAVLGGWIFSKLGIGGGGTIYTLAAATVGAVVLVAIARLFSGGDRD